MGFFRYIVILFVFVSCKNSETKESDSVSEKVKSKITFVTNRDGNAEVYSMNDDGTQLQNMSQHDSLDFTPAWSNLGEVYFYSNRTGNSEIYKLDTLSEKLTQLTNHPGNDVIPVPSPDGAWVAFMSDRDSLSKDVYLMKSDGSNVKALTQNDAYEESPSWSPDGAYLLFTRQLRDSTDTSHAANGEIFRMNKDGSNVTRLTHKDGYDSGAVYSPDGSKIAFYGLNENQWDLFIMDANGSNIVNITNDATECYSPSWSPDGNWLVYTAGEKGIYNLWKINLNTEEKIQLTNTQGRNESPDWK